MRWLSLTRYPGSPPPEVEDGIKPPLQTGSLGDPRGQARTGAPVHGCLSGPRGTLLELRVREGTCQQEGRIRCPMGGQ